MKPEFHSNARVESTPPERPELPQMRLGGLARLIVGQSHSGAMDEIHRRTPCAVRDRTPMPITAFLQHLREQSLRRGDIEADAAYDMTIDKFSRIPPPKRPGDEDGASASAQSDEGVDCRRYFQAYTQFLEKNRWRTDRMTELGREEFEARALQSLVRRHFQLSMLECRRNGFFTRYVWRLAAGQLNLMMPRHIAGQDRRRWLESHISDVDATRDGEEKRVQAVVDNAFRKTGVLPLQEDRTLAVDVSITSPVPVPGEDLFDVCVGGLAATVAKEKAANIELQRPAIQELGPDHLRVLVLRIFQGLAEEDLQLAEIAEEFSMSKATLTRFAGTRWNLKSPDGAVPDLWRNTAQVLGSDPDFMEAAKRAGVWKRVGEVLR